MSLVDPLFVSFQSALAGRYSIDRELGRGGSAIVYLAREVHLDRLVAIKLLPPDKAADATLRERFLREARLAAKLSHPNIIPIHSVEDSAGFVFFVMSYIDGETLANRVRTRGPLPSGEGSRVLREVAWALAYAHGQGLVHRDVKPDNILLEAYTGRVLVADFGIAGAAGAAEGAVAGTPEFMSPEAVLGKHVDHRSDLYSLGATAYFLFSGRLPFEGRSATEVLAKQVTESPPPLSSLGVTVSRKMAVIVDRCLAKNPEDRPESGQALAEQLGVALDQRRELPPLLRAFVKRHSRLDGAGTLAAGLAILPIATLMSFLYGGAAGAATLVGLSTLIPLGYFVNAARRMSLFGFTHEDLEPAFKSEIEQGREERVIEQRSGLTFSERWAPAFAKTTIGVFFVSNVGLMLTSNHTLPGGREVFYPEPVLVMAAVFSLFGAIWSLAVLSGRRDIDTEFWGQLWTGRLGKDAFVLARRLLGKRASISAVTHRATELSLGLAAEELYESLPRDARLALGDLPSILKRLQADAQLLRKRHDEIQGAIGAVNEATASPELSHARALRDELHVKLGETVGALETIRLNLLRLHAGSATVEGLTTHLGIAADVSEAVERLVAAHEEVDRTLKFPRAIAPSPA
jgi:tRNA A-37 threonylcarbamoyl transferase component Bud32